MLGRDAKDGGANGLIGLLDRENTGRDSGGSTGELVPAVMPTDQKGGDTHGLIGLLNQENTERKAGGKLASLQGLGSVGELFLNSRPGEGAAGGANMRGTGGDAGNVLLLPAVKAMGDGSVKPADLKGGQVQGGGPHVTPTAVGIAGRK